MRLANIPEGTFDSANENYLGSLPVPEGLFPFESGDGAALTAISLCRGTKHRRNS
jgi:hypothetical protein